MNLCVLPSSVERLSTALVFLKNLPHDSGDQLIYYLLFIRLTPPCQLRIKGKGNLPRFSPSFHVKATISTEQVKITLMNIKSRGSTLKST